MYYICRNNSSQLLLDAYAENAIAFNRLMLTRITISESMGSTSSTRSGNPFFGSESSGSTKFFIGGEMSETDDDDEDEVDGQRPIPARHQYGGSILQLSPPSSSLAERRKLRFNSVSLSQPSSPSL